MQLQQIASLKRTILKLNTLILTAKKINSMNSDKIHGFKYKNVKVYLRVEWRRRPEAEFRRPG